MATAPVKHLFTVEEYYRMAEAGVFGEDARVELIEGEVYEMTPPGEDHVSEVDLIADMLWRISNQRAIVRVQSPVRIGPRSAPQPDVTLLRREPGFYGPSRPAGPADVLLLVEVADTSLNHDLRTKAPVYAHAGILEYWILDLRGKRLLVFRGPSPAGYQEQQELTVADSIAPLAFPDSSIAVAGLFPQ